MEGLKAGNTKAARQNKTVLNRKMEKSLRYNGSIRLIITEISLNILMGKTSILHKKWKHGPVTLNIFSPDTYQSI